MTFRIGAAALLVLVAVVGFVIWRGALGNGGQHMQAAMQQYGMNPQDVTEHLEVVEASPDAHAAKAAALVAHATQVVVGPTGRACALSNNMTLPILAQEHYVLAAGSTGDRDERGWETDLLAGLGLDGSGTR